MYVPVFNAIDDDAARTLVGAVGSAELVTTGADGFPVATLLPVLWEGDRLVAHLARGNPQWREIAERGDDGAPALAIVAAHQAYVSPAWYASKAEHGRVVPTWNYSAVHLSGRVRVHDDPDWLRGVLTRLTDAHESHRAQRWRVSDAPEVFVTKQLRAIVGVELLVERVEGKAKLSQNRSPADRAGVVAGLLDEAVPGARVVAEAMRTD
ncbi:FMN-binding negative transcriptional regulator [Cellulomonas palmilytica]|uniref:FMN-binding negative transcriptional regulator n=1 Tax=Cellulomonas palmilytica TaxID=2608402 RepID=UPI001F204EB1|nr:FMN-binding negative transcriptional regulator [Cellulomonas palmilytica]UJP39743.1 FMN-binding negative transcriptional regulator [Cellulomonas palmilytica]